MRLQLHPQVKRMGCWSSSSYVVFTIYCLAVCFISIGFTGGVENQRYYCNRSSCGDIQIRYPFRLKGDPIICGDPNHELICRSADNRTFIEFSSIRYLAKKIDYISKLIKVMDIGLLSSNCSIPHKFLPSSSIEMPYNPFHAHDDDVPVGFFSLAARSQWVSIMKCSKKLTSQRLQLYPCKALNDSYLYGVVGYQVKDLAPACSFLSWPPTMYDSFSPIPIFMIIQNGFFLSWGKSGVHRSMSTRIRFCLRYSSWAFEDNFEASNILTFFSAVFKAETEFPNCMLWPP